MKITDFNKQPRNPGTKYEKCDYFAIFYPLAPLEFSKVAMCLWTPTFHCLVKTYFQSMSERRSAERNAAKFFD